MVRIQFGGIAADESWRQLVARSVKPLGDLYVSMICRLFSHLECKVKVALLAVA